MSRGSGRLRSMVISAALGALALVLPAVFHMVGLGSRFLPMLLPLLLNSFLSTWPWALAAGLTIPWISAFATGMPPIYPPVAGVMSLEAGMMALAAALVRRRLPLFWSVAAVVLCGRLAALGASWALAKAFGLPPAFASLAMLAQGLPGVALQLAVVPLALRRLTQRKGVLFE